MEGCGGGKWKGHRYFACMLGRAFFCPVSSLQHLTIHDNMHQLPNPRVMPGSANVTVGPGEPVIHHLHDLPPAPQAVLLKYTHTAPSSDHLQHIYSQAGSSPMGYQQSDPYYPSPSPSGWPPQSQPYLTPLSHQQYLAAGVLPQLSQQVSTSDASQQQSKLLQPQYGRQDPPHPPSSSSHHQQPLQQPLHQPIQEAVHSDHSSGPEWVGKRATVPTTFQNVISNAATAPDDNDHSSDYNAASSQPPTVRRQPNTGHEAMNPSSKSPSPRKPTPAPRKTTLPQQQPLPPRTEYAMVQQQPLPPSTEYAVEQMNIHRLSMDEQQRMQHQTPSSDTPGSELACPIPYLHQSQTSPLLLVPRPISTLEY